MFSSWTAMGSVSNGCGLELFNDELAPRIQLAFLKNLFSRLFESEQGSSVQSGAVVHNMRTEALGTFA